MQLLGPTFTNTKQPCSWPVLVTAWACNSRVAGVLCPLHMGQQHTDKSAHWRFLFVMGHTPGSLGCRCPKGAASITAGLHMVVGARCKYAASHTAKKRTSAQQPPPTPTWTLRQRRRAAPAHTHRQRHVPVPVECDCGFKCTRHCNMQQQHADAAHRRR